ncbi:MAG: LysR substrate-binding domain-containing protein [Silvanigrellaceae bacterium]
MCQFVGEYFRNKRVNICLINVRNEDLSRQLSDGEIDFAFTSSILSCVGSYFVEQHYLPVSLICQPGLVTRFSRNIAPITFADWIGYLVELPLDLILPSHHLKLREETDRFCSRNLIRKSTVFVSSSISSIIRIASEGLGFALLPRAYAIDASNLKRIHLLGPKEGFWQSSIFIASRDKQMLGQVSHLLKSFSI